MTLPSDTGSTETWSTINQWVQICSGSHSCTAKVNGDWYPTRLVERISNERFRIIRSDSSLCQPGRGYITLSHRWGHNNFLKLTMDNLSELENGFPIAELRKTFQDALIVAQRMNIPYVWIDSLCIIQPGDKNKHSNWEKEAGSMVEVYSNSFCNLSADWGDETTGLFFKRKPIFEPPCAILMRWKFPNNFNEFQKLPPDGDLGYIVRCGDWIQDIRQSPLNHRGWVMQERLLAPRVLHFSPEQVSWECGQLFSWEKAPWCYSHQAPLDDDFDWMGYGIIGRNMQRVNLNHPRKPANWKSLVAEYTKCDLTKHSDRLVAFAGIAQRQAPVKGQYVAGLWAKSLPGALLWHALRTDRSRTPTKDYYSPTFSWAAVDDLVYLPHEPDEEFSQDSQWQFTASADFIEHRNAPLYPVDTTTMRAELNGQILMDHKFGPLTSPEVEVRVRGILRSCWLVPPRLMPAKCGRPIRWWGDSCAYPSKGVDNPAVNRCFEDDTMFRVAYDRTSDKDVQSDSIVYYYTIIRSTNEPGAMDDVPGASPRAQGLFLKSVDASMGRFERLGLVTHLFHQQADICQPLGNERDLPAWSYDEKTGEHTFYVV